MIKPISENPHLKDFQEYKSLYKESIENPDIFFKNLAQENITWIKDFDSTHNGEFSNTKWFEGGKTNVSMNCLDRHLQNSGNKVALIWEGDNSNETKQFTFKELYEEVCKFANVLKSLGIKKGSRVCIYMPMIPEAAFAMLACTRIGAIHSVVFGGFSPESLKDRILDANCEIVITADEGLRGGKKIPLKANVDEALEKCPDIKKTLVIKRTNSEIKWDKARDVWYEEIKDNVSNICEPEPMDSEDPLFVLYTSGSTGKPKGVLHTTAGYLLGAHVSFKYLFGIKDSDVYWCTADVGWITGHTYILYGPLSNGTTTLMFEGVPTYPSSSRCWEICDKYNVSVFYTAPTAIRALMAQGNEPVLKTSRKSLRVLGTVGEPINPEAWKWYFEVPGNSKCPIVDTWWQTETGGILISPQTGAIKLKPGSASKPFYGIEPCIVDKDGNELEGECEGMLCMKRSWPGQMRTVYGDHKRFIDTYFSQFDGKYFTGDGCRRDKDGYYWITGRVDDVIIVSGHNLGTAEIESAFVAHPKVAEAAVVGYPHDIKGNGLYCYVTLNAGETETGEFFVKAGEAILTKKGEWIRYSTPRNEGAEYIAVCLPAFSPNTVHRDDA